MASTAASSSSPAEPDRPVIVRVKRKASQSRLDAFWLEISERPMKRPLIDFSKLSISESSAKVVESNSRKVFVQHVETITTSEVTVDILRPLLVNAGAEATSHTKRAFKTESKQDQLLSKAKKQQEILSKNARFEQIWRSRKEKNESDSHGDLNEMFRLYDIVRVEGVEGEESSEADVKLSSEMEVCRMMADFLPLLRETIPTAAAEVETDIRDTLTKRALPDKYVYDYYAVRNDMDIVEEKVPGLFPLVVRVEDEEFYEGPDDSDGYPTDDSNAEDNPLNDYPDEDPSDIEDEEATESSGGESEEGESSSQKSSEHEVLDLDGSYPLSEEDGMYDDFDSEAADDDDDEYC